MFYSLKQLRLHVRRLKNEIMTLYLAARDPRTPWYAKVVIACVVAYALSPIDLIPDFIPVLGYLDDLILLPLGIYLALKLIPAEVLIDARRRAAETTPSNLPKSWPAALIIATLWFIAMVVVAIMVARFLSIETQVLIGA